MTVFFQRLGGFIDRPEPDLVFGGPGITNGATGVAAADLDGDGDLDLISGNLNSENITIFWGGR